MEELSNHIHLVIVPGILLAVIIFYFFRKKKIKEQARIRPTEKTIDTVENKKTEVAPITDSERVYKGLVKTRGFFQQTFDRLFTGSEGTKFYDDVEEALLTADVGIETSEKVLDELKKSWGVQIASRSQIRNDLKTKLSEILLTLLPQDVPFSIKEKPHVIMIVGVNGAGKTTTIAKLCHRFISEGKKVLVGAADTFRAAATEQLKTWVERTGAEGVFQAEGSDPSAVSFDSVNAAKSRGSDVCIIDTAGRLHTKSNLMDELTKMKRVISKAMPGAPHDIWLVLDGTMGQNALQQAQEFNKALDLTGLIITKLDGSAKGGALLSISSQMSLPVSFIGVGETPEDLIPFKSTEYVSSLLTEV